MRLTAISALLLLATVAVPHAQPRPNLSGRWVLVSARPPVAPGVDPNMIIRQDGSTFTAGHGAGPHSTVYRLDGKENVEAIGEGMTSVTQAEWVDGKLVTQERTSYPSGLTRRIKQVWALTPDDKLTLERTDLSNPSAVSTSSRLYARRR